jgi:hypothetical protein
MVMYMKEFIGKAVIRSRPMKPKRQNRSRKRTIRKMKRKSLLDIGKSIILTARPKAQKNRSKISSIVLMRMIYERLINDLEPFLLQKRRYI